MSQWRMAQGPVPTPQVPVRAAQYVRMSTEHQKYSTENQADIIAAYAAGRGFEIVETYADQGKSGLKIEGRDALRRVLADVQAGSRMPMKAPTTSTCAARLGSPSTTAPNSSRMTAASPIH